MKRIVIIALHLSLFSCTREVKVRQPEAMIYKAKSNVTFTVTSKYFGAGGDNKAIINYAIYVENFDDNENVWSDIENDGLKRLDRNSGLTTIYYFKNKNLMYDVSKGINNLPDSKEINENCVAGFWYYPNRQTQFTKFPLIYPSSK
ncbi:MAG: hypothetical protein IPP51_13185 [Bacteroidetes bacterium]|nr:hypothetical protein [Bacteroidota bacterium]